jgi:hypothetical protein
MGPESSGTRCTWCGAHVAGDDGFRLYAPAPGRSAVFCRLEHVVPWAFNEGDWNPPAAKPTSLPVPEKCSECGAALGESALLLVRHRGEHRIPDGFCSTEHLSAWAKAGGRWR